MNELPSKLLVVTDRHQAVASLPEAVAGLLAAGLRWFWLRDRDLPPGERLALAETLMDLARRAGGTLSIGADIDLAAAVDAPGVHLRRAADVPGARKRLGATALLGVSAHSIPDVQSAREAGADYATLSPIFTSASKPDYGPALGPEALAVAARIGLPIVALGGVTAGTAKACLDAQASAVAMMGPPMRGGAAAMLPILELIRRS